MSSKKHTWKQQGYPSAVEWITKLWDIQTKEYFSALKSNELSSHERTLRKHQRILLSEISPSEKAT